MSDTPLTRKAPCDPVLGGLTRLATAQLRVPATTICMIVDGRMEVAAAHGSAPGWDASMAVGMAERVARVGEAWSTNGLVPRQGGAYLGIPLVAGEGGVLGVLGCFSPEDRTWSDDELRCLNDLAACGASTLASRAARDKAESHLALQHAVGMILAGASTLEEAIGPLLDAVAESLGFDVGEYWPIDAASGLLRRHDRDLAQGSEGEEFSSASREFVFRMGEGLPGRIWKEMEPAWIETLDRDPNFCRIPQAVTAGLRTAVGFPIVGDGQVMGVMTFLAHRTIGRDELLLRTLKTLGHQIGELAVRSRVQAEVAGLNLRLQSLVDAATHVAIIASDTQGRIVTFNTGAERMLGYSREEVFGQTPAFLHLPAEIQAHAERLREEYGVALSGFDVFVEKARRTEHDEREWTYLRKDGEPLAVTLTITAVRDARGEIVGFLGIAQDLTESKRSEREMRKFAALVEQSGDFIAMATLKGRVTYVNPAGRALAGLEGDDSDRFMKLADFLDEPTREIATSVAIPAARDSGWWFGEANLRRFDDGEIVAGEANVFLVRGAQQHRPLGLGLILRDIRARKQTEAMLLDSGARLRGILESSLDALITIDHEGHVIEFNPAAVRIFGWSRETALGQTLGSLMIPPEYRAMHVAGMKKYLATGEGPAIGKRIEIEALRSDGSRFPVELAISVVKTGGPPLFTASLRDISDRKRAEAQLLESERRFRGSFDNAPIGMALVGLDGRWLEVNRALCEILGYAEDELLKRDFQAITHPEDLHSDLEQMHDLLAGVVRSYQIEKRYIHREGHEVWVILAGSLVRDVDGKPLYFVAQIEDVTLKRQVIHSLRAAKEEAEAANRAKAAFLANMSHEVRTPMAAVLGYADMLLEPTLEPGQRDETLQAIRRNGAHLMQVIDDILDLSKIEAGRMDLDLVPYGPWQVALEVTSLLGIRAEEQGVRINTRATGILPAFGTMDPTRVRQVLMNLVSNAIKFTERGGYVELRVEAEPSADRRSALLRFEVQDTGIGMSPAEVDQLFTPFQQADTTTTRKFGGTGLGLSICRRLVDAMGGLIRVKSEVRRGSVFTVEIPLSIADANVRWFGPEDLVSGATDSPRPEMDAAEPRKTFTGKILVVEDSPEIRRILTHSLRKMGLVVEEAANGRIGVERATTSAYDLILMDMQMPELDGYGAASSIRRWGLQVPIVALTAHAMAEDRERSLRAGCDDYLTKPVALNVLAATLARYLAPASVADGDDGPLQAAVSVDSDDQQELRALIREFAQSLPAKAERFRSLIDAGDITGLSFLAHQIRGVAGMYGFPTLTDTAGLIEDAAREGQDADLLDDLVTEFADEVARIRLS